MKLTKMSEPREIKVELCSLISKVAPKAMPKQQIIDWGLRLLDVPRCWKKSRGEAIKIAVLDTGVATQHGNLKEGIIEAVDFTNSREGAEDIQGHGTHVIGILAARAMPTGVVGVAPQAKIYSAKVINDNGSGTPAPLVKGIEWAVEQGVDIISISLSFKEYNGQIQGAISAAAAKGIFIISAAGNRGEHEKGIDYPARCPEVITVGAVDESLNVTNYSSAGKEVDVVAPGQCILSTHPPQNYSVLSGTSMAVPFVTGVLALLLGYCRGNNKAIPFANHHELRNYLKTSSIDLGSLGKDDDSGYGLLDPLLLFKKKSREALLSNKK